MIRKSFLLLLFLCFAGALNAQVAKWMMEPEYDSITVNEVGLLEVSLDGKVGLADRAGRVILPIEYDEIGEFSEGYAVLHQDGSFCGITDISGNVTPVSIDEGVRLMGLCEGTEYFSCGRLIVRIRSGGRTGYGYMSTNGFIIGGPYAEAYPFSEGYAVIKRYTDNASVLTWDMVDVNCSPVDLGGERKTNIMLISSFRDGEAIVQLRNRFYTISTDNFVPQQIYADSTASRRSMVVDDPNRPHTLLDNGRLWVRTLNDRALYTFGRDMRLMSYSYNLGDEVVFEDEPEIPREVGEPQFSAFEESGLYGLNYCGELLLPAQFEAVEVLEEHFAIVRSGGKVGVVEADANATIRFRINNDVQLSFRHQKLADIGITVEMPSFMPDDSVLVSEDSDFTLDGSTHDCVHKTHGTYITCNCIIDIPEEIDQSHLDVRHSYHFHIEYAGLVSKTYEVFVDEHYDKYYSIEMGTQHSEITALGEVINIEFKIGDSFADRDTQAYSKDVKVYKRLADGTLEELDCVSTTGTLYSFDIAIDSEIIDFVIDIIEVGCPAIRYPYVAHFTMPEVVEVGEGETPSEPAPITVNIDDAHRVSRPAAPTLESDLITSDNDATVTTIETVDSMKFNNNDK